MRLQLLPLLACCCHCLPAPTQFWVQLLGLGFARAFVLTTRSARVLPWQQQQQPRSSLALHAKRKRKRKRPPVPTASKPPTPKGAVIVTSSEDAAVPSPAKPTEVVKETTPPPPPPPIIESAEFPLSPPPKSEQLNPVVTKAETKPTTTAAAPPPQSSDTSAISEEEKSLIGEIAKFEFKATADDAIAIPEKKSSEGKLGGDPSAIPLPNIQDALKQKERELAEQAQAELEALQKPKIKRSDKDAFVRLLEQQPFADADDSYFEKEEYGTVSALLGEGTKPFLGAIPTGPLQVGHFIGALGIVLMAFVEYPGFPLTNLPTPLRQALQGGLATVYAINTILAVWAVFKASERGQNVALWAAKTFSVGGLALDQLTQLPTLAEVEANKATPARKRNQRK